VHTQRRMLRITQCISLYVDNVLVMSCYRCIRPRTGRFCRQCVRGLTWSDNDPFWL